MRSSNPVFTNLEKQAFTDNVEVATKSGITIKNDYSCSHILNHGFCIHLLSTSDA